MCGMAKAECGGKRQAVCGGWCAPGSGRWAVGGGDNGGNGNEQATAVYSDVRLFSSCGDSNGIQYLMFDFDFLCAGST
jgi:hypothetical protein